MEIVAANGRLRYEQGGQIFWQPAIPHAVLSGYRHLDETSEVIPSDMNRYQHRIAEQLSLALRACKHSLCTGAQSIACQEWLNMAISDQT